MKRLAGWTLGLVLAALSLVGALKLLLWVCLWALILLVAVLVLGLAGLVIVVVYAIHRCLRYLTRR